MEHPNAATVDGRAGHLRTRADGSLLWEADLDGEAVAGLIRRALLHGGLRCHAGGVASTVRVQGCYFDAAARRVIVELVGEPVVLS
jgi:hypothetical protein